MYFAKLHQMARVTRGISTMFSSAGSWTAQTDAILKRYYVAI